MGFKTKLDFGSDNRQLKQFQFSETVLSGKTTFGVDDIYIPENITGDTINIEAKQYIQAGGLIVIDGTQQDGYVLTSDANGKASWQAVSATTSDNNFITGATFNTLNGVLTLSGLTGGTVTVDLDDRYSLTGHTHTESDISDLQDYSLTGHTHVEYSPTGHTHTEYLTGYTDNFITGATFNTSNGILTLSELTGGTVTVDLDGRYLQSETDSQTLSFSADTGNLSISNGNTVSLTGLTVGLVPYTGATQSIDLGFNSITSNSFIKSGGLITEFLMADGSVTTGGGPSTLSGLTDTTISVTPTDNQALAWDTATGKWIPQTISVGSSTLSGLTDTELSGITHLNALIYNSGTTKWESSEVVPFIDVINTFSKRQIIHESTEYVLPALEIIRGVQTGTSDPSLTTSMDRHYLQIGNSEWLSDAAYSIGYGWNNNDAVRAPMTFGAKTTSISSNTLVDAVLQLRANGADTWTTEVLRITNGGNMIVSGNTTSNSFIKIGGLSTEFLKADGSVSTGSTSTLSGASDTTISSTPTDNQVLAWDTATGKWIPQTIAGGGTVMVVISSNTTAIKNNTYVLSGGVGFTLTLPATPTIGDSLEYVNLTSVLDCVLARNGEKIMNLAEDLTLDKANDGHVIRYSGVAIGWVLI